MRVFIDLAIKCRFCLAKKGEIITEIKKDLKDNGRETIDEEQWVQEKNQSNKRKMKRRRTLCQDFSPIGFHFECLRFLSKKKRDLKQEDLSEQRRIYFFCVFIFI